MLEKINKTNFKIYFLIIYQQKKMDVEHQIKIITTLLVNRFDIPLSATSLMAQYLTPILHDYAMGKEEHDYKTVHLMAIEFGLILSLRYLIGLETDYFEAALDVGAVELVSVAYEKNSRN